jgi:hypothetical protein
LVSKLAYGEAEVMTAEGWDAASSGLQPLALAPPLFEDVLCGPRRTSHISLRMVALDDPPMSPSEAAAHLGISRRSFDRSVIDAFRVASIPAQAGPSVSVTTAWMARHRLISCAFAG